MRLIRKIHRYIGWVLGLAFFLWVMSGILMMLEEPTPEAIAKPKAYKHDFAAVTLSPAEVIEKFVALRGSASEIRQVTLRPFGDRLIYEIRARKQPRLLIDARTGEPFEVTPAMAIAIAGDRMEGGLGEPEVSRLDEHSWTYPWGALPVYKLAFDDGRGTIAYVALSDGAFRVTDRSKQLWHFLVGFHTFNPLNLIVGSDMRRQIMFLASALALVIVVTGYYMEFFSGSRARKKIKSP